jgi:hypothetical protein
MSVERWKRVPGFPAYEVSDWGQIRSYWKQTADDGGAHWYEAIVWQRYLILNTSNDSAKTVNLTDGEGNKKGFYVASLVAELFIGPRPYGKIICFLDGDRDNQRASNMRYMSKTETYQFYADNFGRPMPDYCSGNHRGGMPRSCTNEEAVEMREKYAGGKSMATIAEEYAVCPATAYRIITGLSYKDAGGPIGLAGSGPNPRNTKWSDQEIREARESVLAGEMSNSVASRFGMSVAYLSRIVRGHTRVEAGGPIRQ